MSQQLTISSLFSTLALVVLALFMRAGEMADTSVAGAAVVHADVAFDRDA